MKNNGPPLCLHYISQGILGQILENVRAEFASSRPPMPIFPAINDSSMRHLRPLPQAASSTYNSTPLHTMTLAPAAFRPTQIPLDVTVTQAMPTQVAEPTITSVVEPPSTVPVNIVVQPPHNTAGVQNPDIDNQSLSAITTTPSTSSPAEGLSQSSMSSNPAPPSAEDMDIAMSTTTNSMDNNT